MLSQNRWNVLNFSFKKCVRLMLTEKLILTMRNGKRTENSTENFFLFFDVFNSTFQSVLSTNAISTYTHSQSHRHYGKTSNSSSSSRNVIFFFLNRSVGYVRQENTSAPHSFDCVVFVVYSSHTLSYLYMLSSVGALYKIIMQSL